MITAPSSALHADDYVSDERKTFGLLGNFPGDENLMKEILWTKQAFVGNPDTHQSIEIAESSFSRLLALLEKLPFAGRNALASQILAVSPARDQLLEKLFDHCLVGENDGAGVETSQDDDFVLLFTNSTSLIDTNKYHILQIITILLSFCTPQVSANISRRYCQSASTRYQSHFLTWCVQQPPLAFSNDELWQFFQDSSGQVQRQVLEACKRHISSTQNNNSVEEDKNTKGNPPHPRQGFLIKVLESTTHHDPTLIFYCSSDYLETKLSGVVSELGFRRWSQHGQIYLKYVRNKLQQETNSLKRGSMWTQELEPALPNSVGDLKRDHVFALQKILLECEPLELERYPHLQEENVRVHLEELAEKGHDISNYQGVQPVVLKDDYYRRAIPRKERYKNALQAVRKAVQERDWRAFERSSGLVSLSDLPFGETFANASMDDLWSAITGLLARRKTSKKATDGELLLQYFAETDFTKDKRRSFTIDALWDWQRWHLRSTPDRLSPQQAAKFARAARLNGQGEDDETSGSGWGNDEIVLKALWRLWYKSLTSRYMENRLVELTTSRVLQAKRSYRPQARSRITLDARYGHVLLDLALVGIRALPSDLYQAQDQNLLLDQLKTLLGLYGPLNFHLPLLVVDNLNKALEEAALQEFVPRLANVLHFNPTIRESYVTKGALNVFRDRADWLSRAAVRRCCGPVIGAFLSQVLSKVLDEASADKHHISLPHDQKRFDTVQLDEASTSDSDAPSSNKRKLLFVYYNSKLHADSIQHVQSVLRYILKSTKNARGLEEVQAGAWNLLVESEFGADREKLKNGARAESEIFLNRCCDCLCPWLLEREKAAIVEQGVAVAAKLKLECGADTDKFRRDMRESCRALQTLGLLPQTLESDVFEEAERKAIMLQTQHFQYDIVQQSLREGTTGMNGDSRAQGHLRWLQSALSTGDLTSIAAAIEYTVARIKNEAGLHRRIIFDFLASTMGDNVVAKSLKQPINKNLLAAKGIADKLAQMLQNDLARRDSVGRLGSFKNISTVIITGVSAHDPTDCTDPTLVLKDLRQLWVSFAIQMHWQQTRAESGEAGLMAYRWQAGHAWKLRASSLVSSRLFDEAYPRPESIQRIGNLRTKINLIDVVVDNLDEHFSPKDFVGCLDNALSAVWDTKFPCGPLSFRGTWCPEKPAIRIALLDRITTLISVCGIAWEEVPQLTAFFDRTFVDKFHEAPAHHFLFASELLQHVLKIYTTNSAFSTAKDSYFYEIPRLAAAVDCVFRYSIESNEREHANNWYGFFSSLVREQGSRDWSNVSKDSRFMSFLAKHTYSAGRLEPLSCRPLFDDVERSNRDLIFARKLLDLTKSAVQTTPLQEALKNRQDIIEVLLSNIEGTVKGPFIQEESKLDSETLLYEWLQPSELGGFSPAASRRYAECALKRASDPNASVATRVEAIEKFVASPSVGREDIMRALQKADIAEPIREAIIVKVFSLDSPWHIVSFLLNSSLVNKEQQRMAAALLGHVAKYVQVDKVVRLLGLLLDNSTRGNLGMQLHKAIVRMLFESKAQGATSLLDQEWKRDLPMEIRHIIVEKCVETIANADPRAVAWEWEIVEGLAKSKGTPKELLVLFFKPAWMYFVASSLLQHSRSVDSEADKVFGYFNTRGEDIGTLLVLDQDVRRKYYGVIQCLEDTVDSKSWKMISKAYRLTFSVQNDQKDLPDDMAAVEEMKTFLVDPNEESVAWDEADKFGTKALSQLLGTTCVMSLNRDKRRYPEKKLSDVCRGNITVGQYQVCFGALVERLMDVPPRKAKLRKRIMVALECMIHAFYNSQDRQAVLDRFKDEISLIADDASMSLRSLGRHT